MEPLQSPDSAPHGRLVVNLGSNTHAVSALSSTLRTLHAAVREAVGKTASGQEFLDSRPAPILTTEITSEAGRMQLSLFFDRPEGEESEAASQAAFCSFMAEVVVAVTANPQPTLWEANTRVRPKPENQRLKLFLDDVFRLRDVEILGCGRRVRISASGIDIAPQ